jgi:AbrB family looped-hinge helix DNA binding protein
MAPTQKLSRVQRKGQITIPVELRERLGIQEGDFVSFVETPDGILLMPQKLIPSDVLDRVDTIKDAVSKRTRRAGRDR